MKLSQVGELGLLAELERRGLAQAIENDAAQVDGLVVTQDALVEGVHFRLDWISWRDLGWRAAAVNLSDLAASGADPAGLVVSLAAPGETNVDDVLELYEGIAETGVPVVGGDTTRADQLMLSVTALGRSERVPGRSGARPGDQLVVTGPLGAAGAAFRNACRTRLETPSGRIHSGIRVTAVQPILRYPGMLLEFGVLKTKRTPSRCISSTSRIVSREKMPRPCQSGCVAVSTARTERTSCVPLRQFHRRKTRTPTIRPFDSATRHGDVPNGLASCFHCQ